MIINIFGVIKFVFIIIKYVRPRALRINIRIKSIILVDTLLSKIY